MPPSALQPPAERFARIVNVLFHAIALRRDTGWLAGPVAMLLWTRLGHLRERVTRLAARIAAGKGSGLPRRKPTPGVKERTPRRPPQRLLPRDVAWLIRLVPEAAAAGSQLRHLLADPDMAQFAAAAPQLGRLIGPLCRSLGVERPPCLLPPPRPKAPKVRQPKAPRPAKPRPWPASGRSRTARLAWPLRLPPCAARDPTGPPGSLGPPVPA
jgi:hypothetical protein